MNCEFLMYTRNKMMKFQSNSLNNVVSGLKLTRHGLKVNSRVKNCQKWPPKLQTPQTLKLSRSTHNENFMVWRTTIGLYDLRVLLSSERLGKSYEPLDVARLTG